MSVGIRRPSGGHEGVTEITLDRPEALNALSTAMARYLIEVCGELAADRTTRVVVLTASGDRAFCVGADLKERNAMRDAEMLAQRTVFREAFGAVLGLPQPAVAAVHGYALGGGPQLALRRLGPGRAADLILTGRRIDAGEADRLGLVDRRVPAGTARTAAL